MTNDMTVNGIPVVLWERIGQSGQFVVTVNVNSEAHLKLSPGDTATFTYCDTTFNGIIERIIVLT
jgi:hypothetical protein